MRFTFHAIFFAAVLFSWGIRRSRADADVDQLLTTPGLDNEERSSLTMLNTVLNAPDDATTLGAATKDKAMDSMVEGRLRQINAWDTGSAKGAQLKTPQNRRRFRAAALKALGKLVTAYQKSYSALTTNEADFAKLTTGQTMVDAIAKFYNDMATAGKEFQIYGATITANPTTLAELDTLTTQHTAQLASTLTDTNAIKNVATGGTPATISIPGLAAAYDGKTKWLPDVYAQLASHVQLGAGTPAAGDADIVAALTALQNLREKDTAADAVGTTAGTQLNTVPLVDAQVQKQSDAFDAALRERRVAPAGATATLGPLEAIFREAKTDLDPLRLVLQAAATSGPAPGPAPSTAEVDQLLAQTPEPREKAALDTIKSVLQGQGTPFQVLGVSDATKLDQLDMDTAFRTRVEAISAWDTDPGKGKMLKLPKNRKRFRGLALNALKSLTTEYQAQLSQLLVTQKAQLNTNSKEADKDTVAKELVAIFTAMAAGRDQDAFPKLKATAKTPDQVTELEALTTELDALTTGTVTTANIALADIKEVPGLTAAYDVTLKKWLPDAYAQLASHVAQPTTETKLVAALEALRRLREEDTNVELIFGLALGTKPDAAALSTANTQRKQVLDDALTDARLSGTGSLKQLNAIFTGAKSDLDIVQADFAKSLGPPGGGGPAPGPAPVPVPVPVPGPPPSVPVVPGPPSGGTGGVAPVPAGGGGGQPPAPAGPPAGGSSADRAARMDQNELRDQLAQERDNRPPPTDANCQDAGANCIENVALCKQQYYVVTMRQNCRKTCGVCVTPNQAANCNDANPTDCARWGPTFCSNTKIPKGMKLKNCARMCNLCP